MERRRRGCDRKYTDISTCKRTNHAHYSQENLRATYFISWKCPRKYEHYIPETGSWALSRKRHSQAHQTQRNMSTGRWEGWNVQEKRWTLQSRAKASGDWAGITRTTKQQQRKMCRDEKMSEQNNKLCGCGRNAKGVRMRKQLDLPVAVAATKISPLLARTATWKEGMNLLPEWG